MDEKPDITCESDREPDAKPTERRYPVKRGNAVFWRLVWLEVTGRAVQEVVCAKCLYPLRGHGGESCPECGADLQQGVIHPIASMRWERPVIINTILLFFVLTVAAYFLHGWVAPFWTDVFGWKTSWMRADWETGLYDSVTLSGREPPGKREKLTYSRMELTIDGRRTFELDIDLATMTYRPKELDAPAQPLTVNVLATMLTWSHRDSEDYEQIARTRAEEVFRYLYAARDGTLPRRWYPEYRLVSSTPQSPGELATSFHTGRLYVTGGGYPSPGAKIMSVLTAAAPWLLGIIWLTRWHKRAAARRRARPARFTVRFVE